LFKFVHSLYYHTFETSPWESFLIDCWILPLVIIEKCSSVFLISLEGRIDVFAYSARATSLYDHVVP
jgi:hypothetical protein